MLTSSNLFSRPYFPSFFPPRTSFMQCVIFLHKYLKIQRYSMIYSKSHHFVVSHIYIYINPHTGSFKNFQIEFRKS
jgi:hypothetical protein